MELLRAFAVVAICLAPPAPGELTEPFAPVGAYGGHWGVDFAAEVGDTVRAPVSGVVTFAGSVAGMKSVTLRPLPDMKVSVSYLSSVSVTAGQRVTRGAIVGSAGLAHGRPGVHLSVRLGGEYVDPLGFMGCRQTDISRALRLVEPPRPYPRSRAHRNTRRDLRSDPYRPSPHRGDSAVSVRTRSGAAGARWKAMAKG